MLFRSQPGRNEYHEGTGVTRRAGTHDATTGLSRPSSQTSGTNRRFCDARPARASPALEIGATVSGESEKRALNVFFDVDNTLIMWNGSLRPHTRDVFTALREDGHTIYIWSGIGIRQWDMKRHELDSFVEDYFIKPLEDHHAKLESLGVPMTPDFVIDDHKIGRAHV